jgi:NTP pyrophosphatase (non-canonical NTP hydrolase)
MTIEEYHKEAIKTVNINTVEYFTIGLVNECGELLSPLKKHLYHNKPIDIPNLKEELGDVAWYIVNLMSIKDFNLKLSKIKLGINYSYAIKDIFRIMRITLDIDNNFSSQFLLTIFNEIVTELGYEIEEILDLNIDKLRKRHGNAYSKEFYNKELE